MAELNWALNQIMVGRKVRRSSWPEGTGIGNSGCWCNPGDQLPLMIESNLMADDWELYDTAEPEGHDFHWVLQQLKAGKRVKRKAWVGQHSITWSFDSDGLGRLMAMELLETDWVLA